jgi:predicted phage terminase large subunit-like protein
VRACGFEPAPHHLLLIDRLERLARGEFRRLFVFMPPGSAKSTYATVLFPAWYLAQSGSGNVLAASHSVSVAERFSRKVRNLVNEHSHELGYTMASDSQAAGRWETSKGQEYYAAGVGTGIAGIRAKLGIIDDPIASREQADSERVRESIWQWHEDDYSNRLMPGALELFITTRWHEDDPAGRKIGRDDGVATEILSLPAIAGENDPLGRKPGEWLWEGEYGYAQRLREKKAAYDAAGDKRSWASMFQQNPVPDEGLFLDVGKIQRVKAPPTAEVRVYAASDYATKDGSGDYTVHVIGGLDADDNLHILDLWRKQTTTDVWVEQMKNMVRSWLPLEWGEENGVIIKAVSPQIDSKFAQEPKAYVSRVQYPVIHDKPTRARTLQARIASGKLCISPDAYWADELIAELSRFPASTHDDQVDAVALLAIVAATRGPPKKKKVSGTPAGGSFWGT